MNRSTLRQMTDVTANTVKVTCTDTGLTVDADVLERSPYKLRVALKKGKSVADLNLSRRDTTKVYVGSEFGLEFYTKG